MEETVGARAGGDVRARFWDEFVGQENLKRRLDVRLEAAVAADRPLDHVLLTAPPGYGKTTLANMIAWRLGRQFKPFVAPVSLSAIRDVLLEHQEEHLVLFIDEVHLATKREQEDLLTLLEEGFLELGDVRVVHDRVTVVAGTTARDKVIPALYDRFPIKPVFEEYTDDDMGLIVMGMAERLGVEMEKDLAVELGAATGGTPRNARGLVSAYRDLTEAYDHDPSAFEVRDLAGVTRDGLNEEHLKYMRLLRGATRGKMGLNPIAARMQLRTTVVEDMERLLLKRGYVEHAEGGRVLTPEGHARLAEEDA
jgi:Holliday junction DNA helicase RuvB